MDCSRISAMEDDVESRKERIQRPKGAEALDYTSYLNGRQILRHESRDRGVAVFSIKNNYRGMAITGRGSNIGRAFH